MTNRLSLSLALYIADVELQAGSLWCNDSPEVYSDLQPRDYICASAAVLCVRLSKSRKPGEASSEHVHRTP